MVIACMLVAPLIIAYHLQLCVAALWLQEARALACLPQLADLCFADPMWGDCPLAGLCNYQT